MAEFIADGQFWRQLAGSGGEFALQILGEICSNSFERTPPVGTIGIRDARLG